MSSPIANDWLVAGPLLIQRLKDQIPELKAVESGYTMASVMAGMPGGIFPTAYVVYIGFDVIDDSGDGIEQSLNQRWGIVLGVENANDLVTPAALQSEAGPLIAKIRRVVAGWTPVAGFGPMIPVKPPNASYQPQRAFFPLEFTTTVATDEAMG